MQFRMSEGNESVEIVLLETGVNELREKTGSAPDVEVAKLPNKWARCGLMVTLAFLLGVLLLTGVMTVAIGRLGRLGRLAD